MVHLPGHGLASGVHLAFRYFPYPFPGIPEFHRWTVKDWAFAGRSGALSAGAATGAKIRYAFGGDAGQAFFCAGDERLRHGDSL